MVKTTININTWLKKKQKEIDRAITLYATFPGADEDSVQRTKKRLKSQAWDDLVRMMDR